jgi:alpha,alpha-trehalase
MSDPLNRKLDESKTLQMKKLRVRNIIPVDLNSIIYRCHVLMAHMYNMAKDNESPFADQHSKEHTEKADKLRSAILALHWDKNGLAFFDFLLTKRSVGQPIRDGQIHRFWSGASLAPYWSGIWPDEFNNCSSQETKYGVMKAFSGVRDLLNK